MAHSCVTAKNPALDVALNYAFACIFLVPCSASKLARHSDYGVTGRDAGFSRLAVSARYSGANWLEFVSNK
ncbi:hypothetical protein HMPREF9555_01219 [Selenomonas artemidis F0399]|uniref:Uncharacterized protein n=1 Tax=Selenomonas artemidis F0399 TaxID=749551 RepID=E7N2K3_9FIRM|nr:hypothetical protein HMPREF9555_01219 [Selenomonas artemidis F0399]